MRGAPALLVLVDFVGEELATCRRETSIAIIVYTEEVFGLYEDAGVRVKTGWADQVRSVGHCIFCVHLDQLFFQRLRQTGDFPAGHCSLCVFKQLVAAL